MTIDKPTLEHLDIFSRASTRGPALFGLLDHTSSVRGREALRRRLVTPPSSVEAVLELQHAHRALAEDASSFRDALASSRIDQVDDYLRLSWLLPSQMPIGARFRSWHAAYLREARDGYEACRTCLPSALRLAGLAGRSSGALLDSLGRRLHSLLNDEAVVALRRGPMWEVPSPGQLAAFDEIARGRARDALAGLAACLAELDALVSLAEATRLNGWTYPAFADALSVRGLVHPLLGSDGIPNDVMGFEGARVFFVTGPNMAGKSTFLKALTMAVLLAHVGAGVPAQAMQTPFFDACFSCAHVIDDVAGGESFFLAEVRRVAALARTIVESDRTFAIMDEPFRGTNVHDATDATREVLRRLVARPDAVVLVASHLANVAAEFEGDRRVALLHFAANSDGDEPVFDFKLARGASTQRLGMQLLHRERVLPMLEQGLGGTDSPGSDSTSPRARYACDSLPSTS